MSALEWLLLKRKVCPYPAAAALLVQMAISPQLCAGAGQPGGTIEAVCELCQVVRGVCTGTHTCAVQMVNGLLPFGGLQRRSAQSFCLHLNVGIPAAAFRRGVSGLGSLQEAEPPALHWVPEQPKGTTCVRHWEVCPLSGVGRSVAQT